MDPNITQSSFIPKQSLAKTVPPVRRSSSLFTVVALVILVLSVALWGLGYAFQQFLNNEINSECRLLSDGVTRVCGLRVSLNTARESLGEGVLKKIERLDLKLNVIERLLRDHVVLTPIFDKVLAPLTLQSIQYKKFVYDSGTASLEGIARSYKDVAVQANKLNQEKMIKSSIFSDLDLDAKGNIVFKLKLEFDPALTRYSNYTLLQDVVNVTPPVSAPVVPIITEPATSTTPSATSTINNSNPGLD